MTEKNLIKAYTGATNEKRIDIIIKNYTEFIGIVDGYTDGLRYMIENEKESNYRQSVGDLGVRIQTGGMPVKIINGIKYIGILEVPKLSLQLPVMSHWSYDGLKIAPGRYQGSVYKRNIIIAGHNYRSHFSRLKTLDIGSTIYFTDVEGNKFKYRISDIEIIKGTDTKQMKKGVWDMTLFTCTYGGQNRMALRCTLTS